MNRKERRAGRIRAPGPDGGWLYPTLLLIKERDTKGRPTTVRVLYDDETVGDVIPAENQVEGGPKAQMLLVFMGESQGFSS